MKMENRVQAPIAGTVSAIYVQEGDEVESLRYDLGKCVLIKEEETFYYESLETGEKISWIKMIDAATEFQKVRKLD